MQIASILITTSRELWALFIGAPLHIFLSAILIMLFIRPPRARTWNAKGESLRRLGWLFPRLLSMFYFLTGAPQTGFAWTDCLTLLPR